MTLDLSDYIQRMIYLGAYERWETHMVRRYLRRGMCMVDVGANIGYYTLLGVARIGRDGRIVAIEPSPIAADLLATTLKENEIHCVQLERCALGQAAGEAILYDPLPDNHSPYMRGDSGAPGKVVQVRTLDELMETSRIDRIDLLKIDVEGFEPEVFAGAQRLLAGARIGAILCEFNEFWLARGGKTGAAVYRELLSHGFVDRSGGTYIPGNSGLSSRFLVHRTVGS